MPQAPRSSVLLRSLGLAAWLALSAPAALAKGSAAPPPMEETGISSFDAVFQDVSAIQAQLAELRTRVNDARATIRTVAGVPADEDMRDAFEAFGEQAAGSVRVGGSEREPRIEVAADAPPEVTGAAANLDEALAALADVAAELAGMGPRLQALAEQMAAFPPQVQPELVEAAGMKITDLPVVASAVKRNIRATKATAKQVDGLAAEVSDTFAALRDAAERWPRASFSGGTVPTAARSGGATASTAIRSAAPASHTPVQGARAQEIADLVDDAQVLFDDAETEDAALLLDKAIGMLPELGEVLPTDTLLRLYRLRAVVAIAEGDEDKANEYAERAVVIDPIAAPPPTYGPVLRNRHKELASALRTRRVKVKVKGGGRAWIDGVEADPLGYEVTPGSHLVQVEDGSGISSSVKDIPYDTSITARPVGGVAAAPAPEPEPDDELAALDEPAPRAEPRKAKKQKDSGGGIKVGWLVTGGIATAAGGGLLALSYVNEQTFLHSDYSGSFDGISREDDFQAWKEARRDQIRKDALLIRSTYFAGYALVGVGVVASGISFLATPTVGPQGAGLTLSTRW